MQNVETTDNGGSKEQIMKNRIGLIAGEGKLPEEIFQSLSRAGFNTKLYSLREDNSFFSSENNDIYQIKNIDIESIVLDMRSSGITRLMMAGLIPKSLVYAPEKLGSSTRKLLKGLAEMDDHSLLGGIVSIFEAAGISVMRYIDLIPSLMAEEGVMTQNVPGKDQLEDLEYGLRIMKVILPLSFGQSIVTHNRSVVSVEAMEGTDETIIRAGKISSGGVLIKMMKPGQDERYDIPTVGKNTLENMKKAGLKCLAVEAFRTIILDRKDFIETADGYGISVTGVKPCRSS